MSLCQVVVVRTKTIVGGTEGARPRIAAGIGEVDGSRSVDSKQVMAGVGMVVGRCRKLERKRD